jgi:sRNA-binding carbon storage regulator CsrA
VAVDVPTGHGLVRVWVGAHDIDRGKVQLSFEAAADVSILREELLSRDKREAAKL